MSGLTPTTWRGSLGTAALLLTILGCLYACSVAPATAASAPGWTVSLVPQPTHFQPADKRDEYLVVVKNVGGATSKGTVTLTDALPAGVTTSATATGPESKWKCTPEGAGNSAITCTFEGEVPALAATETITIPVTITGAGTLTNSVSVSGGGASAPASATVSTLVSPTMPDFGFDLFTFGLAGNSGESDTQAGDHPNALTTTFHLADFLQPPGFPVGPYPPVAEVKDIVVNLPAGFTGDPTATPRCPESSLILGEVESLCPAASQVGTVIFNFLGEPFTKQVPVYNLVPEAGYPAEFGFNFVNHAIIMHASVRPGPQYGLEVTVPGVPTEATLAGVSLTFFGDPAEHDGLGTAPASFLTNPTRCSKETLKAKIEADSWERPGQWASIEAPVYPEITGCGLLEFQPTFALAPESGGADEPSGYDFNLKVPQSTKISPDLATPELKKAVVRLPEGVSLSPSAANGLVGCNQAGPEGINLGSGNVTPQGQDLGDPEATELGAGHPGGNGSPYDDGLYHTAHGHCPKASQIATVEVAAPLLSSPLTGHLYVAEPQCGGDAQPPCTEADAKDGKLFATYLEVEGSGVIIKLKGVIAADGATGQLTATFDENPQLPFSELKIHLMGGPRAPLANPETCGAFGATADFTPWSTPLTPDAVLSAPPFAITGCEPGMPFVPTFSAGTVVPNAAASTSFSLTVTRGDRQQGFASLATTLPAGLLGVIALVPQCEQPQASAGTCPEASRIGTATVAAGPGPHPLWLAGKVYLTGPFNGAPFGLTVVVPAQAGPFNLGVEVVRAAITVDPRTTAVTVTSAPIPHIKDGVPFRLKTINVTVDRPGFIINPTNCSEQSVSATVAGLQGAVARVSSPFAVAGCTGLAFKPKFTASTSARTSKANGAVLDVKVSYPGGGQANIASVKVDLPKALPSRLTTLQKACTAATFEANPARCPTASFVGVAKALTPVLSVPLTGPAILVSHAAAAFPDLAIILQAEGVRVDLVGNTFIRKGITSSTFASVPDDPISAFELYLPQGRFSALAAFGDLCRGKLKMPTKIVGQNGAVIKQTTIIRVSGCPKAKKRKMAKRNQRRGTRHFRRRTSGR